MKYLMFILMVFGFSMSVNAFQVESYLLDDVDSLDASETTSLALASELEKVPIDFGQMPEINTELTRKDIAAANTAENHGDSLPYEVGWQSHETI